MTARKGTAMTRVIEIPYRPRAVQQELHAGWESHRWSVNIEHRRLGKSVAAVNHLIKQAAQNPRPRPRYAYVGPFLKQTKKIAWDYLKHFTADIPGVKKSESELMVELPGGARIQLYGADNPDAIRGVYLDGAVLDEAAQQKKEIWGEIIRPMLADRQGWVIFLGTPKGMDNLLFERWEQARNNPAWFTSLHRADSTGVIPDEEMELIRQDLTDPQFRQEMLCDWTVAAEDALIPWDLVHAAAGRHLPAEVYNRQPLILALDVARFGGDKSVMIARQGLAVLALTKWRGLDLMTLAGVFAQEINERAPDAVMVDAVGLGAGVVDRLRQLGHRVIAVNGGKEARAGNLYYNLRAETWALTKEWLEEGGAIPDDPDLRQELMGPTYSFDARNRLKLERKQDMKARGLASPDCGDALALTFAQPVALNREAFGAAGADGGAPQNREQWLREVFG